MEPMPELCERPRPAHFARSAAAGPSATTEPDDQEGQPRALRFEVRAVAGKRTPLLWAEAAEVERLRARATELAALLAEAADLARRGLPIALEADEAFVVAVLAGDPALVRQLLGRPQCQVSTVPVRPSCSGPGSG